jgi:N-acetylmuramoyl-L-alanine amidase
MRVVFDIGHGSDTYPKSPDKGIGDFHEHTFNSAVAVEAKRMAEAQGIEVLFSQQPNAPEVKLNARCNWIAAEHKKKPVDCLVSFHANNGMASASGWGVFHWHNSEKGERLAQLWAKHAAELPIPKWGTGIWKCVPNTWTNFDIVRKPAMPCILIEHFFFTNKAELALCNTPGFISKAATVTVKALCEYGGIQYKDDKDETIKRLNALLDSIQTILYKR